MGRLRAYVKLIRPYGILFLGFTPVFGAICNGECDGFRLGMLLLIGLLTHVFVFVQNDYYDVEVDNKSRYVADRPLTSGSLIQRQAILLFSSAFLLAYGLFFVALFTWQALLFLFATFLLMTVYNKYSKRITGMEYILSTGVFTLGLFGAFTVSETISPLALIISFVGFLQWLFSVGVSANLKDVEYDARLGIRTTPMLLGVKVIDTTLIKPPLFLVYSSSIQLLFLFTVSLPFLLGLTMITVRNLPIPLLCFLLVAFVMLFTTWGILTIPLEKRATMLRYEGAHEGFALLLIPIVLMSHLVDHLGVLTTLGIILLFILWPLSILRLLYGKTMIPLE